MRKVILVGLILMLLIPTIGASGLGVGPSKLEISDALRGGEFGRSITVFNTDDEAGSFSLTATGDICDWIYFYNIDSPTTPITNIAVPGRGNSSVLVKFKIPADATTGNYKSTILVGSTPTEEVVSGDLGQAVVIQIPVDVLISVTGTQILTGVVKSITVADTEVNIPVKIKVEFQNTGNVVAKPEIAVSITKAEKIIEEFTCSETGVKVNSRELIPVEWDTIGKESGDYEANVTVSLGGEVLSTQDLQFKLLPVGTLSRQGNLTSVSYDGKPSVGRTLKILATFRNTGEIDTKAKFVGEVYMDDDLVDTISSEELLVPVRETGTLTAYLKMEQDGSYTIKGHAVYEGKTTETKELSFDVATKAETEPTPNSIPGFGAIGVIIAIASVMGYLVYRRRV